MEKINIGAISFDEVPTKDKKSCKRRERQTTQVSSVTKDVYYEACEDAKECELDAVEIDDTGKILDLSLTLSDVCPAKRVALAVSLNEVDSYGNEYGRGLKIYTIPESGRTVPCDINVDNIRFIMPDDISVGTSGIRHFVVRTDTHYIDTTSGDCDTDCTITASN